MSDNNRNTAPVSECVSDRAGFRLPSQVPAVTVADMADARDAGYADGFKQGEAEGYKAGQALAQEELQQKVELELVKIRQLIQAMQHPFEGFRHHLVKEIKAASVQLCETFLRHTLTQEHRLLEFLVDEVVQQLLPVSHHLVVHVNSRNGHVVQQALASHLEQAQWRIQVNDKLSDGNVFLESGHSKAQIDLEALLAQYLSQVED